MACHAPEARSVKLFGPVPRRCLAARLPASGGPAWLVQMGVLVRALLRDPGRPGRRPRSVRLVRPVEGHLLPGREDRLLGRPDHRPATTATSCREDGQLQMTLLGASSPCACTPSARVDREFTLRVLPFSLDPGTGPTEIRGTLEGRRLSLTIKTPSGERTREPRSAEAPARPSAEPLAPPGRARPHRRAAPRDLRSSIPATLRNAPMDLEVEAREVVRPRDGRCPPSGCGRRFPGITSHLVDHRHRRGRARGEPHRPHRASGRPAERAQALAVPGRDPDRPAARRRPSCPKRHAASTTRARCDRLRVRLVGRRGLRRRRPPGRGPDRSRATSSRSETRAPSCPEPLDPERRALPGPEPFIESDAPEIGAEAPAARRGLRRRPRAPARSGSCATSTPSSRRSRP